MVAIAKSGVHFKDPWFLLPNARDAAKYSSTTGGASNLVAFFTELATVGFQETTNWTADTYKTLLSVSSGKGLVSALIGPTAGGAETTTFEITVDGILTEIAVSVASGERAALTVGFMQDDYSTGYRQLGGGLNAGKTTVQSSTTIIYMIGHHTLAAHGVSQLLFERSLLIRAKHSANITNSTATAYSGGIYRLGL